MDANKTQPIVVATDGSEFATRAVTRAARLSKQTGRPLLIVTVDEGRLSPAMLREANHQGMTEGEAIDFRTDEILNDARSHARAAGATRIQLLCGVGDAASVLLGIAARENADMIVAGRRGRGQLAGLVFGSVSQKLATLAPCCVVVVP